MPRVLGDVQRSVDHTAEQIRLERAGRVEMVDAVIKTHEGVLYDILGETFIMRDEKSHTHGSGLVTPHQGLQPTNVACFETLDCLQVIHAGRSPLEMLDVSHYIYRHSPKKVG